MERIPRAEGELSPLYETKHRYDEDVRYEISPDAANGTQLALMMHMLPSRLKDALGTGIEDALLLKWQDKYAHFVGPMYKEIGGEEDLLAHIQEQSFLQSLEGRATFTPQEYTRMASFLESGEHGGVFFQSEEEINDFLKENVH
jgi:hypothetical protein